VVRSFVEPLNSNTHRAAFMMTRTVIRSSQTVKA